MTATGVGTYDVDRKLAALLKREVDAGRRDFRAEAQAMADGLRRDRPRELRYDVEVAPLVAALRADVVREPTPKEVRRHELDALAAEIRHPELFASARAHRAGQTAKRERAAGEAIVASAMRFGNGDNSPMDRLRRWAVKSPRIADLFAEVVKRQGHMLNQAIIASGAARSAWRTVRTRDGHWRAERATFHGDGRVDSEVRWKFRGGGPWLSEREFRLKVQAARQRARRARRQIPAATIGRTRR